LSDGTITTTDARRGIWLTVSPQGVVRDRNVRNGTFEDRFKRLESNVKTDPVNNAKVTVREDGFLRIDYVDKRSLIVFPDHTQLFITKTGPELEESKVV